MSQLAIIYPVFAQVALTFALLLWLAALRTSALNAGTVRPSEIALREQAWPARTAQVGNCFANQFEAPILFYVLALLVIFTRLSDVLIVALAWVFVLLRFAHAYVHTTSNTVRVRGAIFGAGVVVLLVMWIWFAIRFLTAAV